MTTILRSDAYRVVPWKNGGGITRVIAETDGYRLSIATIERDGPFSDFSGWDRTIVPIEGNGIELEFDGERVVRLDRLYEPLEFRGESQTACRLIDGPVRDFNVMTRRDRFAHDVEVVRLDEERPSIAGNELRFAYVLHGEADGASAGDTLVIDATSPNSLHAARAGTMLCIAHVYPKVTPLGH